MTSIIISLHVIACILLIIIILVQRGRGGGLLETFSGVESLFGTKTSAFLSRLTSVLAIIFFLTCLSLAFLSARQSRSLLKNVRPEVTQQQENVTVTQPQQEAEKEAAPKELPATQAQDSTQQQIPQVPKAE